MTTLVTIASNQAQKEVTANQNFEVTAPSAIFGRKFTTTSALTWGYYGGYFSVNGVLTLIPDGTLALTASSTSYIQVNRSGVVSFNTTGFVVGNFPLYAVLTGASTITSYIDYRQAGGYNNFVPRIVTAIYAGSLTLNWSTADTIYVALTGNTTITMTGAVAGQKCTLVLKQDATGSRLATFGTEVRYGADITSIVLTTTPSKQDKIGFIYNDDGAGKYDVVAITKGF